MRWKRRRRPPARHKRAFGAVGLALLLCALWTLCWERGLAALSPELIEEAARGYVLECLTQAVEEEMAGDRRQRQSTCPEPAKSQGAGTAFPKPERAQGNKGSPGQPDRH